MLTNVASLFNRDNTPSPLAVAAATSTVLFGTLVLQCAWKSYQLSHLPQPPTSSFLFGSTHSVVWRLGRPVGNTQSRSCRGLKNLAAHITCVNF
ncbi:hypothetical protein Ae201684P_005371 [Aphanomyces euteiches]|nr:hypothetical protein Ae201684P_005371 [Aphanomyces euteiches]